MDNNKLLVGQGVGLASGAALGAAVGIQKAKKSLAPFQGIYLKGSDEFYKNQSDFVAKAIKEGKNNGIIKDFTSYKAIKEKAVKAYEGLANALPNALKKANQTKIKWVAGLAAAGLAIGTAITLIASKVKAKKAVKTENAENAQ